MTLLLRFGAHSAGVIPVPIPNTEVKPSRADYTALRETRKVPNYGKTTRKSGFFYLFKIFSLETKLTVDPFPRFGAKPSIYSGLMCAFPISS